MAGREQAGASDRPQTCPLGPSRRPAFSTFVRPLFVARSGLGRAPVSPPAGRPDAGAAFIQPAGQARLHHLAALLPPELDRLGRRTRQRGRDKAASSQLAARGSRLEEGRQKLMMMTQEIEFRWPLFLDKARRACAGPARTTTCQDGGLVGQPSLGPASSV